MAISHFDCVPRLQWQAYCDFVRAHTPKLSMNRHEGFSTMPLSFSPLEEEDAFAIWVVVLGDYLCFQARKDEVLGEDCLPFTSRVVRSLGLQN